MVSAVITIPDAEWVGEALCPQTDPEAFFPEARAHALDAKRVCARCPVIEDCLAWALEHEEHGVWGGLTEAERRDLKKAADG